MKYICGCDREKNINYRMDLSSDGKTLTSMRKDSEGYEVCPQHGVRLIGWPHFKRKDTNLTLDFSGRDLRDNRDPEEIGLEFLAGRNGQKEGASPNHPESDR